MPNQVVVASSLKDGSTLVWDIRTGALQYTFHQNFCVPRTLTTVPAFDETGHMSDGDIWLSAQTNRPSIHAYTWGKDKPIYKCNMTEPIVSLTVNHEGTICVGGSPSGKLYAWAVASGELMRVWTAHFKAVSTVCFSDCGSFILSGGEDATIHVWNLSDVISYEKCVNPDEMLSPRYTFTEHTLAISCIRPAAKLLHANTPIISTSIDGTARIYDLTSGYCLYNIRFPTPIHCVTTDPIMQNMYVGGSDGTIFEVALSQAALQSSDALQRAASVGGVQVTRDSIDASKPPIFYGHTAAISDLCISSCGFYLVSSSKDGTCRVWDIHSRQMLHELRNPRASKGNETSTSGAGSNSSTAEAMTSVTVIDSPPHLLDACKEESRALFRPLAKFALPPATIQRNMSGLPDEAGELPTEKVRLFAQAPDYTNEDALYKDLTNDILDVIAQAQSSSKAQNV